MHPVPTPSHPGMLFPPLLMTRPCMAPCLQYCERCKTENIRRLMTCWIAARALGPKHPFVMDGYVFAHTSPVYVQVCDHPVGVPADAMFFVDWIDRLMDALERDCWFSKRADLRAMKRTYGRARAVFEQIAAPSGAGWSVAPWRSSGPGPCATIRWTGRPLWAADV